MLSVFQHRFMYSGLWTEFNPCFTISFLLIFSDNSLIVGFKCEFYE